MSSVAGSGASAVEEAFGEWTEAMKAQRAKEAFTGLEANPQWVNFRFLSWAIEARCDAVVAELS